MATVNQAEAAVARVRWEGMRAGRAALAYLGWSGVSAVALLTAAFAISVWSASLSKRLDHQLEQITISGSAPTSRAPTARLESNQARLTAFTAYLPAQAAIPQAISGLIDRARAHNLKLKSGEYRAQLDVPGNFMGYRIALPVKGDATEIQEFLSDVLLKQPTLSLESVVFKRDRIESKKIEARLQFVLLTQASSARDGLAGEAGAP